MMNGDPSAQQHLDWARGKSREFDLLTASAQVAAYEGRLRAARPTFRRSLEVALGTGLTGTAASVAAHEAWTEALYFGTRSRERVLTLLDRQPLSPQGPGGIARLRAAIALALSGSTAEASSMADDARTAYPESTAVQSILVPIVRATVLLSGGQPARVSDALRPVAPFELGLSALLLPPYLRGQAYLAIGRGEEAAREFRRVLDNRGVDPFSPVLPMAQLGLARALRVSGEMVKSREAYEQLLSTWEQADDDFAIAAHARAEYVRLLGS
jgi:tetratricopeptide (TPR) repeat protein